MEEASCQARCAGLFRQPREVFLLACNTLATKDEDSRTPEEYLQVLLEHGFDRAVRRTRGRVALWPARPELPRVAAPRVRRRAAHLRLLVGRAARRVHGADAGAISAQRQGDYATGCSRRRARYRPQPGAAGVVQGHGADADDRPDAERGRRRRSRRHLRAVRRVAPGRASACGSPTDACCAAGRAEFRADAAGVPARHPAEIAQHARALDLRRRSSASTATRDAVLRLVRTLNVSALKLELAHFAPLVGWLDQDEFHNIAADGAARAAAAAAVGRGGRHHVRDHQARVAARRFHRRRHPSDESIATRRGCACSRAWRRRIRASAARILAGLGSADPLARQWAAYALTDRQPLDERVLEQLVPYLRDPSPEVATRVQWLFQKQAPLPKRVLRTIEMANTPQASQPEPLECTVHTQTCELTITRPGL